MTSIAADSWEEQATEIRFSRKVREILFCWLSLAFRESDIGGRGPCLYNRATRGCAAPPRRIESIQFTKCEGDPHNRVSLAFRESDIGDRGPYV